MPFPVIPVIMAAASIGKGIHEGIQAKKNAKAGLAAQNAIPKEDPGVRSLLDKIQLRQKYADNGQSRMLAYKNRIADDSFGQFLTNNTRSAGTAPGTVQQGALRGLNTTLQSKMRAGAESEALGLQYIAPQTAIVSDMADRRLNLDSYPRDMAAFQEAQHRTNSNNLIWGGATLLSMLQPNITGGGMGGDQVKSVGNSMKSDPLASFAPKLGPNNLAKPLQTPAATPEPASPYESIDWSNFLGQMISNPSQRPQ